MNRRFRKIVLFGVLSFAVPAAVHAQRFNARDIMRAQQEGRGSNLYGSNPYEQNEDDENGGQNLQDSTQKKKRIRKPLESYFFSDSIRALNNFKWNLRRGYNRVDIQPLDTTLTDWRIDYPFYRE